MSFWLAGFVFLLGGGGVVSCSSPTTCDPACQAGEICQTSEVGPKCVLQGAVCQPSCKADELCLFEGGASRCIPKDECQENADCKELHKPFCISDTKPKRCSIPVCSPACGGEDTCQFFAQKALCLPSTGGLRRIQSLPDATIAFVPPGEYLMGARSKTEGPVATERKHSVRLTRGFWIMQTEVTQGHFSLLMGYNPSFFTSCGERCPVESVSWHEALAFADRLSEKDGLERCYVCKGSSKDVVCSGSDDPSRIYGCLGWRLPNDGEWEIAARAGTQTPFHTGDCLLSKDANYKADEPWVSCGKESPRQSPLPSGSLTANAWNLFDIHGNVAEWCYDSFGIYPAQMLSLQNPVYVTDPTAPKIIRGGGWSDSSAASRSAFRGSDFPKVRLNSLGFRLARSAF